MQLVSKPEPVTSAIEDNPTPQIQPRSDDKSDLLGVRGVNDNFIRVLGKVTLPVEIGKFTLFHDFYILDDVNMPLILGRDFMHDQKAEISFPKQVLSFTKWNDRSFFKSGPRSGSHPQFCSCAI
ncbi:Hypothetical predicted protein [Mytilus galloprovincialis]|uniref:Reverse transcriptase domain-containing protein n=1 Tax=Mytilus galloprovincialis TaxID=29158 RepID=A0A8B6H728_MYTGA|nr:Hypothetical predicted protein [Mytilus galloprovincialis]